MLIPLTDASRFYLGGGSFSEILLVILVFTWLSTLLKHGLHISSGLIIFSVLLLLTIASWVIALHRNALIDGYSLNYSIIRHMEYFLVLFVISQLARSDKERTALLGGAIIGCGIEILIVLLHWSAGHDASLFYNWGPVWANAYTSASFRVWGSFGNPLPLVTYLASFSGILTVLAVHEHRSNRRLIWAGLLVLIVPALLATGSRTALIVMVIPFAYALTSLSFRRLFAGLSLMAVISLVVISTGVLNVLGARLENFGTGDGSVSQRQMVIRSSLDMMQDHPLLGVGPGRFETAYVGGYMLPTASWEPSSFTPENIFLQYGAELGFPALILFLLGVSISLWHGRRGAFATGSGQSRMFATAVSLGLICFLTASLVQASYDAPSQLLLFMLLGFLNSFRANQTHASKQRLKQPRLRALKSPNAIH